MKGIAELRSASGARICLFTAGGDDPDGYWYVQDLNNYRVRACFRVADVNRLHAHLQEAGVKVGEIEGAEGCGWTFEFFDLNGNKLIAWSGYSQGHDFYYE